MRCVPGNVWVVGSQQFREFDEYLLTHDDYAQRVRESRLGLGEYLEEHLARLRESIATTEPLAAAGELPDAQISATGLKISALVNAVPEAAVQLDRDVTA